MLEYTFVRGIYIYIYNVNGYSQIFNMASERFILGTSIIILLQCKDFYANRGKNKLKKNLEN